MTLTNNKFQCLDCYNIIVKEFLDDHQNFYCKKINPKGFKKFNADLFHDKKIVYCSINNLEIKSEYQIKPIIEKPIHESQWVRVSNFSQGRSN